MRLRSSLVAVAWLGCFAWAQPPAPATAVAAHPARVVTLPAGTSIPAVFLHPVATRKAGSGLTVDLETNAPIFVGDGTAIPAGAYLHGTLVRVVAHGWLDRSYELELADATLSFPNGYATATPLRVQVWSFADDGGVRPDSRSIAPAALVAGLGVIGGGAIGSAAGGAPTALNGAHKLRDSAIGALVGGAAGAIVALALLARSGAVIATGARAEARLETPLTLDAARALAGASLTAPWPVPPPPPPRRCYDPGTPGTPPTVIPGTLGTPGTPPTVIPGPPGAPPTVIPGTPPTPGSPPTVIPGTPGTPGRYYPWLR